MKVVVGGTFDFVHAGHEALFKKAFELGEIVIGITSDEFVRKNKPDWKKIKPLKKRIKNLKDYLKSKNLVNFKIVVIQDEFGITLREKNIDAIIVSSETKKTAERINELREKKGMKKLKIIKIPLFLAEDGKPISSERIRRKEIDERGFKVF